jgi:hypothetical protein
MIVIYYIIGFFVIAIGITIWSVYTAELMPDDYDIKPEDVWPLDERPTMLSENDYKIVEEHLNNPKEPNIKLKDAAKKYKEANENNRNK